MNLDPKVQRILNWRESFSSLNDEQFFEIIRMYLGEIKTPYNKQKLTESLGSFIRKEENRNNIIKLLSESDRQLIAAIKIIPHATMNKLENFFKGEYSAARIYEHVSNLEERLIVYRKLNREKMELEINPMLEDDLATCVFPEDLFSDNVIVETTGNAAPSINESFICSFISFMLSHPDLCKADGNFKKKALQDLCSVYCSGEDKINKSFENCAKLIIKAFCNLNLFHDNDKGYTPDWQRIELFASLPFNVECVYLCVASCGHFSRGSLLNYGQLFLDCLNAIPSEGYTASSIVKLSVLLKEYNTDEEAFTVSRFSRMINAAKSNGELSDDSDNSGIIDACIDSAITFGILSEAGKNEEGRSVLAVNPYFLDAGKSANDEKRKVLSIDAGFSITVMPGLAAKYLYPLSRFLNICHFDTVAEYEISRQSVMRAFDANMTPGKIIDSLKDFSFYDIPQNLKISIEEWYHSYSSATLYKGYVLRVNEENSILAEKNPVLGSYIKEVLAPGIFLLNFADDEEAKSVITRSGLDFIGMIHTAAGEKTVVNFVPLRENKTRTLDKLLKKEGEVSADSPSSLINKNCSSSEAEKILEQMRTELSAMKIPQEQYEGLLDRINRKIIVSPSQLNPLSVKFEMLEAGGIDYTGKIHVIESAMQSKSYIEVEQDGYEEPLIGIPVDLVRSDSDANLVIHCEKQNANLVVSVASALRIKKIRGVNRQF